MNKELEIRAAKVLKWERWEGFKDHKPPIFFIPDHHEDALNLADDSYHSCGNEGRLGVHTDNFKFRTSFDWSMLGVKYVLDKDNDDLYEELILKLVGQDGCNYESFDQFLRNEPEQITQAWVEVLENEQTK